jgi:DNA repair protein RecO (recombination protein O)
VTGASLVRPHSEARETSYRLSVGLVGLEAMLRLFTEQERNPKAFEALTRFLDVLDTAEERATEPPLDPLVLSFQLKLLWLSGYLPHLTSCAECGSPGPLVGYSPQAGGAVCERCGGGSLPLSHEGIGGIEGLLGTPLADAEISKRAAREALRVITSSYEYHGGFRLRTLAARA